MAASVAKESTEVLVARFWAAPSEALFDEVVIAPAINKSQAWTQRKRVYGGGPPFKKMGRSVLYRKSDVVAWLDRHATVSSTSEYAAA